MRTQMQEEELQASVFCHCYCFLVTYLALAGLMNLLDQLSERIHYFTVYNLTREEVSDNARYFCNILFFPRKSKLHLLQRLRLELYKLFLLFCLALAVNQSYGHWR